MPRTVRHADDAQRFVENLPDKACRQVSRSLSQLGYRNVPQDVWRGHDKINLREK